MRESDDLVSWLGRGAVSPRRILGADAQRRTCGTGLLAAAEEEGGDRAREPGEALERLRECHLALAERSLAEGSLGEAEAHLRRAIGLPASNPMSWVAAARLASFDAT